MYPLSTPVSVATAEHYAWGDGCDGWHLVRALNLSVIQERMPPGAAELRHRHATARQFFFVLAGELRIEVEGAVHTLRPRDGLEVTAGLAHEVRNDGPVTAEFLVVSQPPTHGDRTPAPTVS
jgi:mannose-6-phosphate isomerase-like protein (cupin superfamily)